VRALVVNELTSPAWAVPGSKPGLTLGEEVLAAFEFQTERCAGRQTGAGMGAGR
jgi:hypothetical protein